MNESSALDPLTNRLQSIFGAHNRELRSASWVVGLFLLLPILIILPASFTRGDFISFPPDGVSLRWYQYIFSNSQWTSAFKQSLLYSSAATFAAVSLGTIATLGLRHSGRASSFLQTFYMVPMILPLVTYALGLAVTTQYIGVGSDAVWPLIAGQATLAFPLVFISVSAGLAKVDRETVRAAESLGAGWLRVTFQIELKQVWVSILGGAVLAFAYCFDEIVVALFLSSTSVKTLPVQIFQTVRQSVSPDVAAASTVVVFGALFIAAVSLFANRMVSGKERRGR